MSIDMMKIGRKTLGVIVAVVCYYVVHEGAHLVFALCTGTFEKIVFMFPGMQIKANVELLSNAQLFAFNLLGSVSTLTLAYILCGLSSCVVRIKSNAIRAVLYYVTIALLLNDPIYLSILCGLFGGGDMNGIALLIPELPARIIFGVIGIINIIIIIKILVPNYKKAFELNNKK